MTPEPFRLTRTLAAPRSLVWQAWTDAAHLTRWFGPRGYTFVKASLELRPGGHFLYGMTSPTGERMWGRFVYQAIKAPERLSWIVSFSDESGGITRHPMASNWPLELRSTLILEEREGRTIMTLEGEPVNATATEQATFYGAFAGMEAGWAGTFSQLEAHLATA